MSITVTYPDASTLGFCFDFLVSVNETTMSMECRYVLRALISSLLVYTKSKDLEGIFVNVRS